METSENASHAIVNGLLITITFKFAIDAFLTAINKRLFQKGMNSNTILLEQCELFENGCQRPAFSSTKTDRNETRAV